ncbi:hypothetical protein HNY73_015397 [Argiope bruennichi]|uniref:Peptidase A2 domain-containing protein n=1 Tax=Argiope bruennichi TaxID=94029 RepID=A0A8T0EXE0_ARGBR|nr:hypothetical protein HNY73_015397 [Argiope bruennichi]
MRALIDTGSQKSCITKEAAKKMKYHALKETTLIHTLFGGMQNPQKHSEYKIFTVRRVAFGVTCRHRRVAFGVTCRPFLLAATLNYYLEKDPEDLLNTVEILKNIDEADKFIVKSQALMSLGKFDLRGWQSNASLEIIDQPDKHQAVPLLGLNWNLKQDTPSCCPKDENVVLTKRDLLSLVHSISSPVTIIPKFMLQESWT